MAAPQVVQQPQPTSVDVVVEGLRKLKTAALLQIVAEVLGVALILVIAFTAVASILHFVTGGIQEAFLQWAILAILVPLIVIVVAIIVLVIISIYAYLLPSAKRFAKWRPGEFSTPLTLLRIGYVWGAVVLLVALAIIFTGIGVGLAIGGLEAGLLTIAVVVRVGLALVFIAIIMFFIGFVGNIVYLFRLSSVFHSTQFQVAAILTIVDIVLSALVIVPFIGFALSCIESILSFIVWILIYIEAGSLEKKVLQGLVQV